jgi:hypothetical protein
MAELARLIARATGSAGCSITVWDDPKDSAYYRVEVVSAPRSIVLGWEKTEFEAFAARLAEATSRTEGT